MRSQLDMLRYESTRKPAVKELYDLATAGVLTDKDIEEANVPLPWYKKALKELRDRHANESSNKVSLILMKPHIIDSVNKPSNGVMMTFMGDTAFIKIGGSSLVELKYGRPVFFPRAGGVWIDTIYSKKIDPKLEDYCTNPVQCDRSHYINTWKDVVARDMPLDAPIISLDSPGVSANAARMAGLGVRMG